MSTKWRSGPMITSRRTNERLLPRTIAHAFDKLKGCSFDLERNNQEPNIGNDQPEIDRPCFLRLYARLQPRVLAFDRDDVFHFVRAVLLPDLIGFSPNE